MAIKLKLDDNGHVVVEDGKPVYIHDDSTETAFDVDELIKKVNLLSEEKNRHWTKAKNLETELEKFSAIEDPETALKAIETVKNLDDKSLIDAGEVEKLKKQYQNAMESEKISLAEAFTVKEKEFQETIATKDATIFDLMVVSKFASSPYFSGEKPKTLLTPDIAADYFGKNFKVVGEGKDAKIVGVINGEIIPSKKNIGEPAEFEEALSAIIDSYPHKERIMRAAPGGAGGSGNLDADNIGDTVKINKVHAENPEVYRAAKERAEKSGKSLVIE